MQVQNFGFQVDKHEIFNEIKKYIEDEGFHMQRRDGSTVLVTYTKDSPSHYGLNSRVIEATADVIGAPFPKGEVPFYAGLGVYYSAYVEEEGVYMCHKGRISSIKQEEEETIFTIDGAGVSQYPGSPVFSYDKIDRILNLIGVIVPADKAVHINFLKNNENISDAGEDLGPDRGKKRVQVSSGQFKGIEQGTGKGPRSIIINGPGIKTLSYKLTFKSGKKTTNPHQDPMYNKNCPLLYQTVLDEFVQSHTQTVPGSFVFDCYKNEYTATRE